MRSIIWKTFISRWLSKWICRSSELMPIAREEPLEERDGMREAIVEAGERHAVVRVS